MSDFVIDNKGVLTEYRGNGGNVVIPDGVTSIGERAFKYCHSLTTISIPDSVTSIGEKAFYSCESLTAISIPDSVTSIGKEAFFCCKSLTSICIPSGVTSIEVLSFYWCEKLTSINIPDSVASIGVRAFEDCYSLTSISIPDSVTSIGRGAFSGCKKLTSNIPDRVMCIEADVFKGCESLINVNIPVSVKSIGDSAFSGCKNLTSVSIPDGVTSIGDSAFWGCKSLTSVNIPDSVSSIGSMAFCGCKSLTSITIPDSVSSIGDMAFSHCESLASITIPNGITSIGEGAFWGCESLTAISIPNSVTSIGEEAFSWCRSLTSVIIPDSVTSIGEEAFYQCSKLTAISIPDSVTSIGNAAFFSCDKLTSVTIPGSVTSIGNEAFCGCKSLTSITIPDSITSIGDSTFWGCESLTTISISGSVTFVGNQLFYGCKNLSAVTFSGIVSGLDKDVFKGCRALKEIRVSAELLSKWKKFPKKFLPLAESHLLREDSTSAAAYFEKLNRLDEYAKAHNTDADTVRDRLLSDFGLDEMGCRTWTLAGKVYTARMENNLSVTLLDENGKVLKSLPKKGAEPEEYDAAKKALAALKKDLLAAAKLRNKRLLADFLEGRPRKAEDWKGSYLRNPLLRQLAKLLVWQQKKQTFILNNAGVPVDVSGAEIALNNSPIVLAHPMELSEELTQAWRDHFANAHLSQPFAQMWEPVLDGATIKPDRYQGATIAQHMLMNREFHGIAMSGSKLTLRDCSAEIKLIEGHHDWVNNEYEITKFRFKKFTRAVNHIAAHFDKGTVQGRLLKDDASAAQWLHLFTLAQITEFINLTTEKGNCPNAVAALLDYKEKTFPEADPFADFVLDL